jgi:hypothetical protein
MTEKWRGIHKLIEEAGEVLQLCGKIGAFPDEAHPSGEDIRAKMVEELGDLRAAIDYFMVENFSHTERGHIYDRRYHKFHKFADWVLTGIPCNGQEVRVEIAAAHSEGAQG